MLSAQARQSFAALQHQSDLGQLLAWTHDPNTLADATKELVLLRITQATNWTESSGYIEAREAATPLRRVVQLPPLTGQS